MKRKITYRLCTVILIGMIFMLLISYYFQKQSAQEIATANSIIRINQIKQILKNNNQEIEKLKENLKEDYFIRAKAAAYIIQNNPKIIGNLEELKKIALLLQVDEVHIFDTEGTIYAGTEPKYFDFTFNSGEQMQFFLPMLENYDLQLCQDVRPNTAEEKLMQYVAVWREDHQGIVQIGMKPVRLLEAMKKNELAHIFSMVTTDIDITLFAADATSGKILGATNNDMLGKNIANFGMKNYTITETEGNVIIGVSIPYTSIYQNVLVNMLLISVCLIILSVAVIVIILRMLDSYIIQGIYEINFDMEKIAAGDLDYRVDVTNLPEFKELSNNINNMVGSLLENTGKLSLIFQNVNLEIAVYEYNTDMKRVLATSEIGSILGIPELEMKELLLDKDLFIKKIQEIYKNPCEQEANIYVIEQEETCYIKIQSYQENKKTLGIIVNVTEEIMEKQKIRYERDIDLLTGLFTRRAFFSEMDRLFEKAQDYKMKAILMMDADNLKEVNDRWGHEYGDKLLEKIGQIIKNCPAKDKIIARLSGDEFVMFVYQVESEEILQSYIDAMHKEMQNTVFQSPDNTAIPVCFSCGYTIFEECGADYKAILNIADQTMYQAKKNRRGEYVKYEKN